MMATEGYSRRARAPKPLSVPVYAVAFGLLMFLVGMALSSPNTAGFGLLFVVWGVISYTFLIVGRRRRAAKARLTGTAS